MKEFPDLVKVKVFLGYLTLIVLASLIVWVIYSEILQNSGEKVDFNPANNKIIYINSMVTNLYQAEGLERTYAQTGRKTHYHHYLKLMDTISRQIDTLALMVNNPVQQMHTDSIKKLLKIKKQNLRELAAIKKESSSTDRYRQAIEKISSVTDTISEPLNVFRNITIERDSVYLKQKKKTFFERLINVFATQRKPDSMLHVRTSQSVKIDTLVDKANPADTIAGFMTALVTEIRDESLAVETRLNQKEQEILANDLTITFQLRQLLSNIEKEELINSFLKIREQQKRIDKATWLIILVGSLALITLIIFLVNILKDITKSQHYRQSLEKAKAYTELLLKSKEQFMLSLTHDLRSPLTSIIGFTRLIDDDNNLSPRNHQYLHSISKASEHMLKLVNDLLELARLETGKLTMERLPFCLNLLIGEIVDGFRPQAQAKNVELQFQSNVAPTAFYTSDPVRITQIAGNLISNALKFTDEGKVTVRVSATVFSEKIDRIRLDVIDTGIGISEENSQLIFEEFARINAPEKQYAGTGLGLTITQKIVNLLHGTIKLESKPGEGSHFMVVLPLEKETPLPVSRLEPIPEKRQLERADIAGKKVWIIDDDETLLEMISIVLKSVGMKVRSFSNPQKAIQLFSKGCADLLILDIQMPGINGVEVLKQIQEKNGAPVTAVAISGMDAGSGGYEGFSAFILKPFHPQTLIDVISGKPQSIPVINSEPLQNVHPNGYNLDQLAAFAVGDPESFREILTSLIDSGKENVALFRQYIQEENMDALSALSHKMLTLFRQMEATDIVELLHQLEQKEELGLDSKSFFLLGKLALEKIEVMLLTIQKNENIPTD